MNTKTVVNIHDAKTRLSELLARVVQGEEIVIAKANKPIARLVAIDPVRTHRTFGSYRGKIWSSEDFDLPLEDKFWAGKNH